MAGNEPGVYYAYSGASGTYTAGAAGMDHDNPDAYEPDDSAAEAEPLLDDVQQNHTITDAPVNYYDWFEIVIS